MKILIIYAYPHHESLNGKILDTVTQSINPKHEIKILDLYQEEFNPVLYFDKKYKRRDLQHCKETQKYREAISWSNHIIFIFPIWWSSMPAILKGFIDRVLVQNFAYSYSAKKLSPNKLLKGRTASIIVTHDTPNLIAKFLQKDYGRLLKTQILKNMCGIKVKQFLTLPNVRKSTSKKRANFFRKINKTINKL